MSKRYKLGKRCSASCVTKDHRTFGECLRSKNLRLTPHLSETHLQKAWDAELDAYDSAVRQGVQPAGTTMNKVREAMEISDAAGVAYQADKPMLDVAVE